jgi:hypothetical protein
MSLAKDDDDEKEETGPMGRRRLEMGGCLMVNCRSWLFEIEHRTPAQNSNPQEFDDSKGMTFTQ